jgi:hypothetical protein
MNKTGINFLVELSMLGSTVLLILFGLVMKYVLPPGSGGGRHGGAGGNLPATFLGLNRHEWGDIHFQIAVVLLSMLAVHLLLHWTWIRCRFQALFPKKISP